MEWSFAMLPEGNLKMILKKYIKNKFYNKGYIMLRIKNHPIFGSGKISEHRLLMIEKLQRNLDKNEHVHHKGARDDNRFYMLKLISK